MNSTFFNEIQTQLTTVLPNLYVRLFKNQFDELEDGDNYSFPFPCCFIEFISNEHIKQLGNGVQLYDPLIVRLHIGNVEYDSADGQMDQNLSILSLKDQIFTILQKWKSTKSSIFIRTDEQMHVQHDQVSVFIQEYTMNLTDDSLREPIGGQQTTPTSSLDLTVTFE